MEIAITFLLGIFIGILIKYYIDKDTATEYTPTKEPELDEEITELPAFVFETANELDDFFSNTSHPKDLLGNNEFNYTVKNLLKSEVTNEVLVAYANGDNLLISCIVLQALYQRSKDSKISDSLANDFESTYAWPMYYYLSVVHKHTGKPVIGKILKSVQSWWMDYSITLQSLNKFIDERVAAGENPEITTEITDLPNEKIKLLKQLIKRLNNSKISHFLNDIKDKQHGDFLQTIGRLISDDKKIDFIFKHDNFNKYIDKIDESLFSHPNRSILLVGEMGVGRSTLIKAFSGDAEEKKWTVFEASATDMIAGQSYIGELEERVQKMIEHLDKSKKVIWVIPSIHELALAGITRYSRSSILDMILPFVDDGKILVIGKTHPKAYEQLLTNQPQIRSCFETIKIEPLDDANTNCIAEEWGKYLSGIDENFLLPEKTIKESFNLAKQFLDNWQTPGSLMHLLKQSYRLMLIQNKESHEISTDYIYTTLSQLTGLPRSILDDQKGLEIDELKKLFAEKVKGQPEAINCLVERVSMIKAGLTDPTKPFGVFLFAGPTGTGKTEIAKALAEFLFGSPNRMIRLDMSEFKNSDSVDRLLGVRDKNTETGALVNQIRKQPFSIILLDEFEKAHFNIWDLFLQVFDDGRLTDKNGNVADFRHSIIILTSNLGATIHPGMSIGFSDSSKSFSFAGVEKAVMKTFRREFINRLDRVVIFRPLSRNVMREILSKELKDALLRRGLRTREWAIEFEDSAIEFLLEKGFTEDLGARPLKRAIERYLLSPISITIVEHKFPQGDQFLYVRSDGEIIHVEFIDPSIPEVDGTEKKDFEKIDEVSISIKSIILNTAGIQNEIELLNTEFEKIKIIIDSSKWGEKKQKKMAKMSEPGFWESNDRFKILGDVEYMDRIEAGYKTAESLINRLTALQTDKKKTYSTNMIQRLAQQIYLLNEATQSFNERKPYDAYLIIEANKDFKLSESTLKDFAQQILDMYMNWAKIRRMRINTIINSDDKKIFYNVTAISGFGAYSILENESGIHVLESPKDEKSFNRYKINVRILPQPEIPVDNVLEHLNATISQGKNTNLEIIRRYRSEPSPLVRDAQKNWRTGRLDSVLEGNFDLFE